MIRQIAAKRYAEGIFNLARSADKLEEWADNVQQISAILSDPQVQVLLQSNRMSLEDKLALGDRLFAGMGPQALNLARLLIAKGRTGLAPQITEIYQEMVDEASGIAHATVTTAVDLSDDEKALVTRRLEEISGKRVVLQTRVDSEILGGLVARLGDTLIDGSTMSKLTAMKRQLEGARL